MLDKKLVLILGGARSGKSTFAEAMAAERAARVLYVATAEPGDDEMRQRIAAHRLARPAVWQTLEEPLDLAGAIGDVVDGFDLVLVDCVTVWISNLLMALGGEAATDDDLRRVLDNVAALVELYRRGQASFVLVANEVGLGLVPPYPLGRLYRDALGRANQRLAAAADEVYFLVAGIPLVVKKGHAAS